MTQQTFGQNTNTVAGKKVPDLQAVLELYGEALELITVVEYFGYIELRDIDHRVGLPGPAHSSIRANNLLSSCFLVRIYGIFFKFGPGTSQK